MGNQNKVLQLLILCIYSQPQLIESFDKDKPKVKALKVEIR
jgi:hypothetical protein